MTVKEKLYDIISSSTNLTPVDMPPEKSVSFPYILFKKSNGVETRYKRADKNAEYYTINIFSTYKGEKEVNDLAEQIHNTIDQLYDLPEVTYVNRDLFQIIDDTSPVTKHGIIIYRILTMEV